ncbi:sigma-70 family RNA polymerase sigma factor [Gracilimonas sp.]|uniref:RNA polymerase sigma factor n=1 Tax=Gracilimonas sp. TaxID=1974203 RepID=UPI0032EBAB45
MVDHLFREESGKMTAILIRLFGFRKAELAEDIVQETFISAMKNWPIKGEPDNPSAWLMQVAKNKAINVVKREKLIQEKESIINHEFQNDEVYIEQLFQEQEIKDSQLSMLFTCCYKEIKEREQLMLILKILGGFSDAEIASALLMNPAAVKKAIYRAKTEVRSYYKQLPEFKTPAIKERVETVLKAVYLLFNEGYKTSFGEHLINIDLCYTALRLAHLLADLENIDRGAVHALLSLMYFNTARFPARTDEQSAMIDLRDQDRKLWDKGLIYKGFEQLSKSRESRVLSAYHLESSIASVHAMAATFEDTNWDLILKYYEKLLKMRPSEIIELNYAIALSYAKGAKAGLRKLEEIDIPGIKDRQYLLWAAKAEMNVRLENYGVARSYYQVACDLAPSKIDEEYLLRKMKENDLKNLSKN